MPIETDERTAEFIAILLGGRSQHLQVFARNMGLPEQESQVMINAVRGISQSFVQRMFEVFPNIREDLMVYSEKAAEEKAKEAGQTMEEWLDNPIDESFVRWTFDMYSRFLKDYIDQHATESSILAASMRESISKAMKNMPGSMQNVFAKYVGEVLKLQKEADEDSILRYFTSFNL